MSKVIVFVISLFAILVFATPMNSETTIKALVEKQATAWETQDVASLVEDFAPDAVFKAAGFTFNGVDGIQKCCPKLFSRLHRY